MSRDKESAVRVLLVEDYADLAEVTAEVLTAEGLDVRIALSGRAALEIAPAFHPQLVLCDLNLPDMTGLQVAQGLRSNPVTEGTFIVMITAMGRMGPSQGGAGQPRIDAFFSKPIAIDAIRTVVERLTTPRV